MLLFDHRIVFISVSTNKSLVNQAWDNSQATASFLIQILLNFTNCDFHKWLVGLFEHTSSFLNFAQTCAKFTNVPLTISYFWPSFKFLQGMENVLPKLLQTFELTQFVHMSVLKPLLQKKYTSSKMCFSVHWPECRMSCWTKISLLAGFWLFLSSGLVRLTQRWRRTHKF